MLTIGWLLPSEVYLIYRFFFAVENGSGGDRGGDGAMSPEQQKVWQSGRKVGAWEAKNELGYRLPMGMAIGVVIGAVIQPLVFFFKGVCW